MVLVFYNINIHIPVELLKIAIQISLSFGQYFNIILCVDAELFRREEGSERYFLSAEEDSNVFLLDDINRNRINIGNHEN